MNQNKNDANKKDLIKDTIKYKAVVVDSMGNLLKLYNLADIAYIGGGFGRGVHSIAEAAGYGVPLATGVNCFNSPDAMPLMFINSLAVVENASMLCD
jgi:3-deoxy-D-manno-octulosonic-acid transferase